MMTFVTSFNGPSQGHDFFLNLKDFGWSMKMNDPELIKNRRIAIFIESVGETHIQTHGHACITSHFFYTHKQAKKKHTVNDVRDFSWF